VIAVVEQDQRLSGTEASDDFVDRRSRLTVLDADRGRKARGQQRRVVERREIDENDATGEPRDDGLRHGQRETGFPDSAGSGQREQRHVLVEQRYASRGDFVLATHERSTRVWQAVERVGRK
jgi:hypothetical protein